MDTVITQTSPATPSDGFVGTIQQVDAKANPHSKRYAYMPPVQNARSEPRTTGFTHFSPGSLIAFRTFRSGGWHNPEFYQNSKAATMIREISAEMAAYNASIIYASVEGYDVGFRLLPFLTGVENAQEYFNVVHPTFDKIGFQCPAGLAECPTCRMNWFESDGSLAYFEANGQYLNKDTALQLKTELYNATVQNRNFAEQMWTEFADGYERTRNSQHPFTLSKEHHHYRKCIHAPDFQYSVQPAPTAQPQQSLPNNGMNLTDAELAEIYAKRAALQNNAVADTAKAETSNVVTTPETDVEEGAIVMHGDSPVEVVEVKSGGWVTVQFKDTGETKTVRKGELSP